MAEFYYDNRFDDATPAVSSTAAGFDAANLTDWRQYTSWKASSLPATITVDCGSPKAANYALLYGGAFLGCTIEVRGSTDNFSASDVLVDSITPAEEANVILRFNSASYRYWRIRITGTTPPAVAIAAIGTALRMPFGQADHDPIGREEVGERSRNMNGYPLGIVSNHSMQEFRLVFPLCTWAFARADWLSAWAKIKVRPFGYAWDETGHADEVSILMGDGEFTADHEAGGYCTISLRAAGVPVEFVAA